MFTIEYFKNHYFYKKDLQDICRKYDLPSNGTKSELNSYILQMLDGVSPKQIKPLRKNNSKESLKCTEINLDTKLLNSGFKLNNEARTYFANYFNVDDFHFKKPMAIKMREVQTNHDNRATVRDLISILNNPSKVISNAEEDTYQWNHFLQDFYKDPSYQKFNNPIKVAAILWKVVRDSTCPKKYHHELMTDHYLLIQQYKKDAK
ncbi:SAP domain-containing protein [Apilactobacillus quenuiae]|uniref:SAP domain-containing protein n=1 Tax=Apilactobacillus quenuiae TaxID=2008377 RepID=UPI000D011C4A|nr:SAP domain-containing protein [Apilactobacillus quenuiae]